MYNIINLNGELIQSVEKINYIRRSNDTKCFIDANEQNAQGISIIGKIYNLIGREGLGEDYDTIIINELDSAKKINKNSEINSQHDELIAELVSRVIELELE